MTSFRYGLNGIFQCSVAASRAKASAFTLNGEICQPGFVTPNLVYVLSPTDIRVYVETDDSSMYAYNILKFIFSAASIVILNLNPC